MNNPKFLKDEKVKSAVCLGVLCAVSYLAVYLARNILGAVTPQMLESGYSESYIGKASSAYFIFYAVGQLINGAIGDKIKARYMISIGLFMAGITNFSFTKLSVSHHDLAIVVYAMTGFFLSMIYGPMTKTVSENTTPKYAARCSLGYTFSSFLGSPLAGVVAAVLAWQSVFLVSSIVLAVMAVLFFVCVLLLERKGVVKYNQYERKKGNAGGMKLLIKRQIIKFTFISIITGVVRTTVVFWMPTYFSQYLDFSSEKSAAIFTGATLCISFSAFIAVFIYERLKMNMDKTLLVFFVSATVFFVLLYLVKNPALNVVLMVLAIMSSNSAASMLWSYYCPSLWDTGMVSTATGFLDFMSYMAAAASSSIFANAVSVIGWGNLILVWAGLMVFGVVIALPVHKTLHNKNSA